MGFAKKLYNSLPNVYGCAKLRSSCLCPPSRRSLGCNGVCFYGCWKFAAAWLKREKRCNPITSTRYLHGSKEVKAFNLRACHSKLLSLLRSLSLQRGFSLSSRPKHWASWLDLSKWVAAMGRRRKAGRGHGALRETGYRDCARGVDAGIEGRQH